MSCTQHYDLSSHSLTRESAPLKLLAEKNRVHVEYVPPKRMLLPNNKSWKPNAPFNDLYTDNSEFMLITASFGRILPDALLGLFPLGQRLNVHPSMLPKYRGAAPIQHAIMNGDKATGVCVIDMLEKSKGIDAGGIWAKQASVSCHTQLPTRIWTHLNDVFKIIPDDVPFGPVRDGLARLGGRLLVSVLRDMLTGKVHILHWYLMSNPAILTLPDPPRQNPYRKIYPVLRLRQSQPR